MKKRAGFIVLMASAAVVFAGFGAILAMLNGPTPHINEEGLIFTVQQGQTAGTIAASLEQAGAIQSSLFFKTYAKLKGIANQFKAGSYLIPQGKTAMQTAQLLIDGKTILTPVTIPEGRTLRQTARILEEAGIVNAQAFLNAASDPILLAEYGIETPSALGWLFPDTYHFEKPMPAEKALKTMLDEFFIQLDSIYPEYRSLSKEELADKVTMASVVEKEYRVEEEAPLMASVFYNRLSRNINMESCATVVYVLTEELGRPHPSRLFFSDLDVESPYNAYRNPGLPLGPISNPGRTALEAAFRPASTNYLFFVVKDLAAGTHQFSTNWAEHDAGAKRYVETYMNKG